MMPNWKSHVFYVCIFRLLWCFQITHHVKKSWWRKEKEGTEISRLDMMLFLIEWKNIQERYVKLKRRPIQREDSSFWRLHNLSHLLLFFFNVQLIPLKTMMLLSFFLFLFLFCFLLVKNHSYGFLTIIL